MIKPEVVGYFHSFMVGDEFKVSLSHFTLQPDAYKSVFGEECKAHPVIWLTDHEAARAADKARIAELESLLLEIRGECWSAIGGSGRLLLGDIAALGMRIDAALSQQGKEGER